MNIQRIKKRKISKIEKTEQQIAKEKLFEISYLCDEREIHESQLWSDHRPIGNDTKTAKIETEIHDIIEKKKDNFFKTRKHRTIQTEKTDSVQKYSKTCSNYFLFNTVDSNRVFVANTSNLKANLNHELQSSVLVIQKKKIAKNAAQQSQSHCYYHYIKGMLANQEKRQINCQHRRLGKISKSVSCQHTYHSQQKHRGQSTDARFQVNIKSIILQNIKHQTPQKK